MPAAKTYADEIITVSQNLAGGAFSTVTVEDSAYILPAAGDGFVLGPGVWTFDLEGAIAAPQDGIALDTSASSKNSKLTVGTEGSIYALKSGADGLRALQAVDVTNAGTISGAEDGIVLGANTGGSKGFTITNKLGAEITGENIGILDTMIGVTMTLKNDGQIAGTGIAVEFAGAAKITNSGNLNGAVIAADSTSGFENSVTNSGFMSGLSLDNGDDTVKNSGKIIHLNLFDGDNSFTNTGTLGLTPSPGESAAFAGGDDAVTNSGVIFMNVALGEGNNKLTNGGYIFEDVLSGAGADSVTNTGTIYGSVRWGAGTNSITNHGSIFGVVVGDGADTLVQSVTNSGSIGGVALGNGNDMVKNTGTISGDVDLFKGKNSFTNSGHVAGAVTFDSGDDTATNSGQLDQALTFGDGVNKLTNSGLMGNTSFGSGDDTASNSGTINILALGDGTNKLTNSGHINGASAGAGDDTVTNTGKINDLVLGDGDNKLTNSGTIVDHLIAGAGKDVVTSTGTISSVDLGAGDDSYTGGNGVDVVLDNTGTDTYKLGGGSDVFKALGKGSFTLDGGSGFDQLDLSGDTADGYAVNLGTTDVTLAFIGTYDANTAFTVGGHVGGTAKNFEAAIGTKNADVLIGGSTADSLTGNGGADVLAGGLGADLLVGGAGSDVFYYFSAKDSGVTKATEDRIADFTTGTDTIDLIAVDADSKTAGGQLFHWIGADADFTHTAGDLRSVTVGPDTFVQGDTNGDGKADFTIDLVGTSSVASGDFIL